MQSRASQEALSEQFKAFLIANENIALSYFLRGQLEQALQLLQLGMQVLSLPEMRAQDRGRFLLCYGNMLTAKTQFANASVEEALVVLEQAKQLALDNGDEQLLADALDGLGFAQYVDALNKREGDPTRFLVLFQEALERRRTLHDNQGVSESLFHLGLTTQVLDQMEDARSYYKQALQIAQQHGYSGEASDALRHLGFMEQEQGNFSQAQQHFTESLRLREQQEMRVYLPFAHVALADNFLTQDNLELASFYCQKALELCHDMPAIKRALILSLLSSGRISQAKQEKEQARNSFEQAYAVAQEIHLKHGMREASFALHQL